MTRRNDMFAWVVALGFLYLTAPTTAFAQKQGATAPGPAMSEKVIVPVQDIKPDISGTTLEKKQFRLGALKGKVVLVMFWATDCAVCRDKMPELRENVRGWADKPFEMVLVSVDRSMRDVDSYNDIINKAVPLKQRFTQLWTGQAGYKDNLGSGTMTRSQLPMAILIDKDGKEVERYTGRIPADVWDKIADLL
jgi:thiol-disulfide isomerase/thioredoxin